MKDGYVHFTQRGPGDPDLEDIIRLFAAGNCTPSSLLLEPGIAYCYQKNSSRAKVPPVTKARNTFLDSVKKGYEPVWELLYRNQEVEKVLGDEFVSISERYCMPLWSRI